MPAEVEYADYLTEIREQVCGHCPEHAPSYPLPGSRCWDCVVEGQLPDLVEAIRDADDPLAEGRGNGPGALVCPPSDAGPQALLAWAVREADEHREQRERV